MAKLTTPEIIEKLLINFSSKLASIDLLTEENDIIDYWRNCFEHIAKYVNKKNFPLCEFKFDLTWDQVSCACIEISTVPLCHTKYGFKNDYVPEVSNLQVVICYKSLQMRTFKWGLPTNLYLGMIPDFLSLLFILSTIIEFDKFFDLDKIDNTIAFQAPKC